MASASGGPPAHLTSPPPPPAIPGANPASPPTKRDLKSWWKNFRLPRNQEQIDPNPQGIFGVPLRQSITYANVAISMYDDDGKSYIYGYVPIVVAKCGVYLKEKATGVEGIFRLSGSEKRIKELKTIFDSPDRYGKGLDWDGYTVHDAANVLRRYLNDLPEPVVPLDLYEKFRDPLRGATKPTTADGESPQFVDNFDQQTAIESYQSLITILPPLNRQLLLYILDLLAVFAAKSDENRMTSQNLAAIFQPGMLSHPNHAMAPEEYRLNQCVIIFLIENQDHFILGMQGTAADETTKKEVEAGSTPAVVPATPNVNRRSSGGVYRSSSNASAGAQSVRRDGQIRRNRSVTSRGSKREDDATASSPVISVTPTGGGLGRSNTVPSKKSPAPVGGKFRKGRDGASGTRSPSQLEPLPQAQATSGTPSQSEHSSLAPPVAGAAGTGLGRSQEQLLSPPLEQASPQKERGIQALFQRSPQEESRRQPNKLKKKRIPGSEHPSAQSSSTSLHQVGNAVSPGVEVANPMEQSRGVIGEAERSPSAQAVSPPQQNGEMTSDSTPRASQIQPAVGLAPEGSLRTQRSPPTSLNSSFNGGSDLDHSAEAQSGGPVADQDKEKKSRWRMSRTRKDDAWGRRTQSAERHIRSNDAIDASQTSFGSSSAQRPRASFTGDHGEPGATPAIAEDVQENAGQDYGSGRDEPKGPIGWIRNKYREAKENAEQRRAKSPPGDQGHASVTASGTKNTDSKIEALVEGQESEVAITEGKPAASEAERHESPPPPSQQPESEPPVRQDEGKSVQDQPQESSQEPDTVSAAPVDSDNPQKPENPKEQ